MIRKNNLLSAHANALFIASIFISLVTFTGAVHAATPLPLKHITHIMTLKGDKASPLSLPSDVAVDHDGKIYVVDSGHHRVVVFSQDGDIVKTISQQGNKETDLSNPVGIDVDNKYIYVADKDNHRIQIFALNGTHIKSIALQQGNKKIRPVDVAISDSTNDNKKLLYITGNNNHQVMVYDLNGKAIWQWGGEGTNRGEFRYPATLSFFQHRVYVVDVLNSRVQIFNDKGELQVIAGGWGVLPGQLFRPKGVAVDQKGNTYISDSYLGLIQVFANDSYFRYVLADKDAAHEFNSPVGISIDQHNRLYVCEMLSNQVSVYSLAP